MGASMGGMSQQGLMQLIQNYLANMHGPGAGTGSALASNPSLKGITPSMVQSGGSSMPPPSTPPSTGAPASSGGPMGGMSSMIHGMQGLGGATGGKVGGALSGAASGAEMGSMAGPWGALAGGVIGGLMGLFGGGKGGSGAPPPGGGTPPMMSHGAGIQAQPVGPTGGSGGGAPSPLPVVGNPGAPGGMQPGGSGSNPSMQQLIATLMKLKGQGGAG